MRDFTLQMFKTLCMLFRERGYKFLTFSDYCSNEIAGKIVILRHDVDINLQRALEMALLEHDLEIKASYYLRIARESYRESICRQIAAMGHEIGYHYEDLSMAKGDSKQAIASFKENLTKLRQLYPVKTICMHGSPLSKWDNRLLWQRYDYRDFGIIGEPYFDIDFKKVLYLTDTGRRWNGADVSIRDKVKSQYNYDFKSTTDIIRVLSNGELPKQLMINVHPHRWNDKPLPWLKEIVWQNTKNVAKQILIKVRG